MSRRVLPSRSAKNKAKDIFISLSDDDDADENVKNGSKKEQVKKSNKSKIKILKEDDEDDPLSLIGFKVESDVDESGIYNNKASVGSKNKKNKKTNYNSSDDDEEGEEYQEEQEEDEEENNEDYDNDDDEYSEAVKKQKTRKPKNKKKSKPTTKLVSSTSYLNDEEEFDYEGVAIKIEPEDDEEYYENQIDDENTFENDPGTIEEEPPPPPPPHLSKKTQRKRNRKTEQPNISFHIIKQERTIGDQNTAVWTTSAFTVTAVLPTPKRNNSTTDTTTTKTSRTRNKIKHLKINCPLCNEEFSRVKLKKHLAQVHPGIEKPYKCSLCNTAWRSYEKLNDHQISHTDLTPFKCDLCEKSFKRKYTLQAHVFYKHTTDGRASLSQFKTKRTVEKIQQPPTETDGGFRVGPYKFSSKETAPFKCPEPGCEVFEDTVTRIQRHYASLHYVRNVMCEQCGKNFPTPRDLSVHMRSHRDGRPWVCETCGSTYKSKAHLNSHRLRTHDPIGHEAYKAYRRMTCRKLNAKKKMLKELEKESTESANEGTSSSSVPLFI